MKKIDLAPIFNPEVRKPGPKPAAVDLRIAFLGGTITWIIALIATGIMLFVFHIEQARLPFLTCILGIVVGIGLLLWEHWYRPEYMLLSKD